MRRRVYSTTEKAIVIEKMMHENGGDVTLTHLQTNIPARTLRDWRQQYEHAQKRYRTPSPLEGEGAGGEGLGVGTSEGTSATPPKNNFDSPPPPSAAADRPAMSETEEDKDQLERLRKQLLTHIFDLSSTLIADPDTVNLRALALSRLLDRVLKLNEALDRYPAASEKVIRIEYVNPDTGAISDRPYYYEDDFNP